MKKILGIDLGTTFSAMSIIQNGEWKIIENIEGARTTPSAVSLTKGGERLVGVTAKRQQITNFENTVYSSKRLIGRKYKDKEVQDSLKFLSYKIREAKDGSIEIKMGEKWYKPVEISAMILQKLKKDAEIKIGEKIDEAVITCPAYFNDAQRKATKVAGEIAGFKVKRVINEPTAAALAYGLNKKKNEQIVVYDFGGGTFDVSVLDVSDDTIEVKGTGGDTFLGGEDFDQMIMNWIVSEFKIGQGIDLSKDDLAVQRLKEAAEKAKIELSTSLETEINLPFITSDSAGPKHLLLKLNRAKLEELTIDFISRSIEIVKDVLQNAKYKIEDIEQVVLVGGQTRMPKIQEEVKKLFKKDLNKEINPDEVVAIGAAVQGGILSGDIKDVLLLDVTPLSFGIETLGGVNTTLIKKNTTIPTAKNQIFSTAADSQPSVEINVLQGERPMAPDNKSLGKFILDGIPPTPRGIPQIQVTFDIDANGILNVSAKDNATGKAQSIRIEGSCGISDEEIKKMKKEADIHQKEDNLKKELIEAKNAAENLIYTGEKTLKDGGDKIKSTDKEMVIKELDELKKIKNEDDLDALKEKTTKLSDILQKIGMEMYQQSQQKSDDTSSKSSKDKNVEDANISEDTEAKNTKEEKSENKKENKDKNKNNK